MYLGARGPGGLLLGLASTEYRIRGLLAEFGLTFPHSPQVLRVALADSVEDTSNELPAVARQALQRAHLYWLDLELQMAWCDQRIACHVRSYERAAKAAAAPGPDASQKCDETP